jgi:hypothetical protein
MVAMQLSTTHLILRSMKQQAQERATCRAVGETVETVIQSSSAFHTGLKPGVNETRLLRSKLNMTKGPKLCELF